MHLIEFSMKTFPNLIWCSAFDRVFPLQHSIWFTSHSYAVHLIRVSSVTTFPIWSSAVHLIGLLWQHSLFDLHQYLMQCMLIESYHDNFPTWVTSKSYAVQLREVACGNNLNSVYIKILCSVSDKVFPWQLPNLIYIKILCSAAHLMESFHGNILNLIYIKFLCSAIHLMESFHGKILNLIYINILCSAFDSLSVRF